MEVALVLLVLVLLPISLIAPIGVLPSVVLPECHQKFCISINMIMKINNQNQQSDKPDYENQHQQPSDKLQTGFLLSKDFQCGTWCRIISLLVLLV